MSAIGWSSSHSPAGASRQSRAISVWAIAAISAAIMPPIEWPTTIGFLSFSASSTSSVCRVMSSMSRSPSSPVDWP
jgi:hypothetical protein